MFVFSTGCPDIGGKATRDIMFIKKFLIQNLNTNGFHNTFKKSQHFFII